MLSGWIAGALGVLGGAKRWLNKEMAIAIGVTAVAVVLLIGGAVLFGAGKSSGGVRERLACLSGIVKANDINRQRLALQEASIASAASAARARIEATADDPVARAVALEQTLAAQLAKAGGQRRVCYTRATAERLAR